MSARVHERTQYSWYCPECDTGSGYTCDDLVIDGLIDAHNAEFHA